MSETEFARAERLTRKLGYANKRIEELENERKHFVDDCQSMSARIKELEELVHYEEL